MIRAFTGFGDEGSRFDQRCDVANEEGIRKTRVHFENLWGGSLVPCEPDQALILNRVAWRRALQCGEAILGGKLPARTSGR